MKLSVPRNGKPRVRAVRITKCDVCATLVANWKKHTESSKHRENAKQARL